MNINDYITRQESIINSCSLIASYNLNIDRKVGEIAFISGFIEFATDPSSILKNLSRKLTKESKNTNMPIITEKVLIIYSDMTTPLTQEQ